MCSLTISVSTKISTKPNSPRYIQVYQQNSTHMYILYQQKLVYLYVLLVAIKFTIKSYVATQKISKLHAHFIQLELTI